MSTKEQVRRVLDRLPEECSIEDVQYELYVLETLRRRIQLADQGDFATPDEADKRLNRWTNTR